MSEVVLRELPENWEWTKLGDVVTKIVGGGTPSKNKPQYWGGNIPWLTVKDMRTRRPADAKDHISEKGVEESSTNVIPEDTVIIATRIGLGKVIRVPYKAAINQDLKALVVPEEIEKGYLEYWFVSKTNYLESIGSGTTVKGIRLEQVRGLDFPLAPLEQQKRIVAKIEELFSHIDAGIEALKKTKQLLKQYRQSVLKAAVTGELTKEWREANKNKLEPASKLLERILKERRQKWEEQQLEQFKAKGKPPKDDKWKEKYKELALISGEELETLPEMPDGWVYTKLGNVIDEPKYGTSKKCSYGSSGIGVLRIPNIAKGKINSEDLKLAQFDGAEIKTYQLLEGDILIIRSNGSINLVGKCAMIDVKDTSYLYAGYLIRLRPNQIVVNGSYLINVLNSNYLRNQIESKAKSTSGVNNINSGELQSLVIPMCSKEESAISIRLVDEKLSSSDRLLEELDNQQIKAEKNKQSILASAFLGRLN